MKKILSAVLCALLLLGTVSCTLVIKEPTPDTTSPDTEEDTQKPVADLHSYEGIISAYRQLLRSKESGTELPDLSSAFVTDEETEIIDLLYDLTEACEEPSSMGYATKDLNRDGTDELVLLGEKYRIYAVFTSAEGKPILIETFAEKGDWGVISEDGIIYKSRSGYFDIADKKGYLRTVQLRSDGSRITEEYGSYEKAEGDSNSYEYYKILNGEYIESTKEEYRIYEVQVFSAFYLHSSYVNKTIGFRFRPVLEETSTSPAAPLADFSDYNAILSMYKKIVGTYADYTQEKWINGEYDRLYTFADDASYEIFHRVFYAGMMQRPTKTYFGTEYAENGNNAYGYAFKDLNGDGVEELILLTDQFNILAIFTMKDEKAVLLFSYFNRGEQWLDESGRLHIDITAGEMTDREFGCFVYEIADGKLNCQFGNGCSYDVFYQVTQKVDYYRIDHGVKTSVSQEEWRKLYDRYEEDCGNYNISSNERTKSLAGLNMQPLFGTVAPATQRYTYNITFDERGVNITLREDGKIDFSMDYHLYKDFELLYETVITGTADLVDGEYRFDNGTVRGTIEFGVNCVWINITESENEQILCHAYTLERVRDRE